MALSKTVSNSGLSALGNIGLTHAIFFVNIGNGIILEEIVKAKYTKNDTLFLKVLILTPYFYPIFLPPLNARLRPQAVDFTVHPPISCHPITCRSPHKLPLFYKLFSRLFALIRAFSHFFALFSRFFAICTH